MNFNEWVLARQSTLITLYGGYMARTIIDYAADAFHAGVQHERIHAADMLNYYALGSPNEIVGTSRQMPKQNEVRKYNYYDFPKWLQDHEPITCKKCGVVMVDANSKPTLMASDNPEYCVSCC